MNKESEILREARKLSQRSESWAELSNALFAPESGLVARTFSEPAGRAAFRKTGVWGQLHDLVQSKMTETGVIEGAEPQKSGRFVVVFPGRCTPRWSARRPPREQA